MSQERAITLLDLAKAAGVSKSTAAHVMRGDGILKDSTRQLVLQTAREMGYRPNLNAQRLSTGRAKNMVGLVAPMFTAGTLQRKIAAVQYILQASGFDVPFYTQPVSARMRSIVGFCSPAISEAAQMAAQNYSGRALEHLIALSPDMIVYDTHQCLHDDKELLREYQERGGRVLCFDWPWDLKCDQVVFDRDHNTGEAVRYLLERGHRNIGFYLPGGWNDWDGRDERGFLQTPRLRGIEMALSSAGLQVNPGWIWEGAATEAHGAEIAREWMALSHRPSALVMVNEVVASSFMNILLRAGWKVPDDVSIITLDNLPICDYTLVPLTAMSYPTDKIAQTVCDLVGERLREGTQTPPQKIEIRGELVERASVRSLA